MEDGQHSSCPRVITPAQEADILQNVTKDQCGCEKSSEILVYKADIFYISVLHILHQNSFIIAKSTWKSGLTEAAKKLRLKFYLYYKH